MTFEQFKAEHIKQHGDHIIFGPNTNAEHHLARIYNSMAMLDPKRIPEYAQSLRGGPDGQVVYRAIPNPYRVDKRQPKAKKNNVSKEAPANARADDSQSKGQVDGAAKEETANR